LLVPGERTPQPLSSVPASPANAVGSGRAAGLQVDWAAAPEAILREARARAGAARPALIGITGPVGSGKSTLASLLSACIVSTDMYLPEYDLLEEHERDDPAHADLARLAQDLLELRAGRVAQVPVWSFHTHRREGYAPLAPADIVVCEGIHALREEVVPHLDVAVFVTAPATARWERCEVRERAGDRGWSLEFAREYFARVAEPTFARHEPQYLARADFVVRNDRHQGKDAGRGTP
jgi:uridine kinase